MQQAMVALTKEIPYATACELFTQLTGRPVGEHLAHDITLCSLFAVTSIA
jgi:hypothetical protein